MSKNKKSVARPTSSDSEPLRSYHIRASAELWERTGWAAAEAGLSHAEFLRSTLERVSRNAQPPNHTEILRISAPAAEVAAWRGLFEKHRRNPREFLNALLAE